MNYLVQDNLVITDATSCEFTFDLGVQLSSFVQWALNQTCTNQYSPEQAMQLLDQAWWAQKLLWELRESGSPNANGF